MESFVLGFLFLLPLVPLSDTGCAGPPALCCANQDNSCYRNCFCDQACVNFHDCCPDYESTCVKHIQTVTLQLQTAVAFTGRPNDAAVSDGISQFLSQAFLQQSCNGCTLQVKFTKQV